MTQLNQAAPNRPQNENASELNAHLLAAHKKSGSWLILGAILACMSVVIGAFAAHALKAHLSEYQLGIIETAANYQMYHALAIVLVAGLRISTANALLNTHVNDVFCLNRAFSRSLFCMLLGVVLFSLSLYLLALTNLKWFAFVTPIGGTLLIVAWLFLVYTAWLFKRHISGRAERVAPTSEKQ